MTPQIFVDMDGVLADFATGAHQVLGIHPEWDNAAFNALWDSKNGWPAMMKTHPTFWMDLPLMPHALDLWRLIQPFHPAILTAIPPGWPTAGVGKRIWAKRMLPKFGYHKNEVVLAVQRPEKKDYAVHMDGSPNILIDDFQKNIDEWTKAGGYGVQYVDGPAGLSKVRAALNTFGLR